METFNVVIALLKFITCIAAAELAIPSCQRVAREQQMRRGYTHQFYRGPKPDRVYRGTGSAYRNGTTGSYLTCAGMCLQENACKSFNFCLDKKRCELNAAVFSNMTDLYHIIGCQYFDEEYHEPEAKAAATSEPVEVCRTPVPLGLEDGTISDDHITASSVYIGEDHHYPASDARLNMRYGWSAGKNRNSWIEIDLGDSMIVSGVITQGDGNGYWVKQYKILYERPPSSSASEYVTDANRDVQILEGNSNDNAAVTNMFHQGIIATVVRIEPVTWSGGVGMRLELLGCSI